MDAASSCYYHTWATDMAATRRGWVQATPLREPTGEFCRTYSTHHCGIWVVLPDPVSPTRQMTLMIK